MTWTSITTPESSLAFAPVQTLCVGQGEERLQPPQYVKMWTGDPLQGLKLIERLNKQARETHCWASSAVAS